MSDYRISIKVRNNNFLSCMENSSYKTVMALHRETGVSVGTIYDYINLATSPLAEDGNFKGTVLRLCDAMGVLPEEAFSESQYECLRKNKAEFVAAAEDMIRLVESVTPDAALEFVEQSKAIDTAMGTLSSREEQILRMRFYDELTLQEIGGRFGVSANRIRQIEAQALRKLRHPKRSAILLEAA